MNSFLQGKKILPVSPLRPMVLPTSLPIPGASKIHPAGVHSASGVQPTVEVIKEGDKVVRVVVVCSCGERVEIECLYAAGG
jgi:hypothetical protein